MAKEIPDGYKEVVVPEGSNVWMYDDNLKEGRLAKKGETVLLHKETLDRDPILARSVKNTSDKPEPDMYDKASLEALKKTLDARDIEYQTTDKNELAQIARSNGVSQQELDAQEPKAATSKSK